MIMPPDSDVAVPAEVLRAITRARPVCWFFTQRNYKCKKGEKCPHLHCNVNEAYLPHVSISVEKGHAIMSLRPPLNEAWNLFFGGPHLSPVGQSKKMLDGQVVFCSLHSMPDPDLSACRAALSAKYVEVKHKDTGASRKPGETTSVACPKYIGHGTALENALNILKERRINADPGVAGIGINAFCLPSLDASDLENLYKINANSGYNRGAVIIMENHGLLIQANKNEIAPPGALLCACKESSSVRSFA